MKIKVSATYDGGEVTITMDENKKAIIAGSGEQNLGLETLLLAAVYQIWEGLEVTQGITIKEV